MAGWWVICLCAEWCGVCREYRDAFDGLAARLPTARVLWIDVEDQAELVGDIDVETFPTLLVAHGGQVRFFGPMAPHIAVLERLVDSVRSVPASERAGEAAAAELLERIQALHPTSDIALGPVGG